VFNPEAFFGHDIETIDEETDLAGCGCGCGCSGGAGGGGGGGGGGSDLPQ
jgi:hypothetical protein